MKQTKKGGAPGDIKFNFAYVPTIITYQELMKMPDLNTDDIDAAVAIISGSARSMGLDVEAS